VHACDEPGSRRGILVWRLSCVKTRNTTPVLSGGYDPVDLRAAVESLRQALTTDEGNTSWADDLPEAPDLPTARDEVVAVVIPRRRLQQQIPRGAQRSAKRKARRP
jgi:hypothetical protein